MSEEQRLRDGLEAIRAKHTRSSESWRSDRGERTEYGKAWHDGFVTALAECSIAAGAALDPAGTAEHDELMMVASRGTDRDWFCSRCKGTGVMEPPRTWAT